MGTFIEPQRDMPVVEETDVVTCGSGPAGVWAGIAANTDRLPPDVAFVEVKEAMDVFDLAVAEVMAD